jgi:ribosomal protein S7
MIIVTGYEVTVAGAEVNEAITEVTVAGAEVNVAEVREHRGQQAARRWLSTASCPSF